MVVTRSVCVVGVGVGKVRGKMDVRASGGGCCRVVAGMLGADSESWPGARARSERCACCLQARVYPHEPTSHKRVPGASLRMHLLSAFIIHAMSLESLKDLTANHL